MGERLRKLRGERGLTILDLAAKAGVSAGIISQIERGLSNPSMKTLQRLRVALGVNLWEFLSVQETIPDDDPAFVRRKSDRLSVVMNDSGLTKELLSPQPDQNLRFMIVTMPPGSETQDVLIGQGQKGGFVMTGEVTLKVGETISVLGEGDSFQFKSDIPHQVYNRSDGQVTLMWIMSVLDTHL
ncbi:helix-turn-helix domain-containing protein [Agrobacterium vitis]|uniref:helix-turn-helix domain-containing protein n=1 Tax=Agrobacterium vitis TaxID=373 RepID=UPI0015749669|nr:helix-turn-helix domain-containing protein [Agrobacterium vitis]NSZ20064.1 helix-turn-helix domain-containing protein [Agrobacterium vitis]QZO07484.1 helix-turn-helix domain-containing protein [Agrobacterium vitis]UJL90979.1 helix-turn-helix domain-containing protein [Agrobacterium vitis]BCH62016.1 transcriptional regulator [Agrobacterium vitis]